MFRQAQHDLVTLSPSKGDRGKYSSPHEVEPGHQKAEGEGDCEIVINGQETWARFDHCYTKNCKKTEEVKPERHVKNYATGDEDD